MSKSICRPIIISNRSISSIAKEINFIDIGDKCICSACALGSHDRIIVKNTIELNTGNMLELWDSILNDVENDINKNFSNQVLFAMRYDDGEDDVFWSDIETYPFIFISVMQVDSDNSIKQFRCEFEKEVKSKVDGLGISAITYLTMDNFDIILVVKSYQYAYGAELIDAMHQKGVRFTSDKIRVYNGYSIVGMNDTFLNADTDEKLNNMFKEDYIEEMRLEGVESTAGSLENLKMEISNVLNSEGYNISEQITIYPTIGSTDNVIVIKNIRWKDVFKLYRNNCGLLRENNDNFKKHARGISTYFLNSTQKIIKFDFVDEDVEDIKDEKVILFMERLNNTLNVFNRTAALKCKYSICYKTLKHIVNSLMKFEFNQDYIFFILYKPLEFFVEKLVSCDQNSQIHNQLPMLAYGVEQIAQNSIHADRQAVQNINFDSRFYEAPIKLNAYYYVFIKKIVELLTLPDSNKLYRFLVCPSLERQMQVSTIFENENERLLKILLPERQIYDLQNMMIMLTHEIAHYVGREFRKRNKRHEIMCESISMFITNFITEKEKCEEYYDLLLPLVKKEMKHQFERRELYDSEFKMEIALKKIYLSEFDVLWRMNKYIDEIIDLFYSHGLYEISKEKLYLSLYHMKMHDDTQSIINPRGLEAFTISLFRMVREAQADIIAILTLNISLKEYVNTIIVNTLEADFRNAFCVFRMSIVYDIMENMKIVNGWTKKDIIQFKESDNPYDYIFNTINSNYDIPEWRNKNFGLLFKKSYAEKIKEYLVECFEEYVGHIRDRDFSKKRKVIQTIYKKISYSKTSEFQIYDIEDIVDCITKLIKDTRSDIINELESNSK